MVIRAVPCVVVDGASGMVVAAHLSLWAASEDAKARNADLAAVGEPERFYAAVRPV